MKAFLHRIPSLGICLVLLAACVRADQPSDADILNFALNLEYLEANFYSCAAFGTPIDEDLWGANGKAPVGCAQAALTPVGMAYAKALAEDEIAHVKLLRTALGTNAADQPLIDIGAAFGAAANAAVNATLEPAFTPYGNEILFFHGAFIFEDVGVSAYKGAAPLIDDKGTLETAAGILAVEAYHGPHPGGAIRALLLDQREQTVFPYGQKVQGIVQAIADLRAAVSGADDDAGLVKGDMPDFLLGPFDENALAHSRTPAQVLKIVYLGGEEMGGFFSEGLSGALTSAAA